MNEYDRNKKMWMFFFFPLFIFTNILYIMIMNHTARDFVQFFPTFFLSITTTYGRITLELIWISFWNHSNWTDSFPSHFVTTIWRKMKLFVFFFLINVSFNETNLSQAKDERKGKVFLILREKKNSFSIRTQLKACSFRQSSDRVQF